MASITQDTTLELRPIGYLYNSKHSKFDAPHQPHSGTAEENYIELLPGRHFEQALKDLSGFDRIWLVWWFNRNTSWKPQVLPPRGKRVKRGVFATRSPHRPNPIGLTPVRLIRVAKCRLVVGEVDLLNGTPILDIKPYIPEIDSFPDSQAGWVAELADESRRRPAFTVNMSDLAKRQADWLLSNWSVDFLSRATEILARDPSPHRTRRITRENGEFRMACGPWRIYFAVEEKIVSISRLGPGYSEAYLHNPRMTRIADREAQIAFLEEPLFRA